MSYNYNSLWGQLKARKKTRSNDDAILAVPIRKNTLSPVQMFFAATAFSLFGASNVFAQTTLIDPNGDGGFNNGLTFESNGWKVANEGTGPVKWTVGTAVSGTKATGSLTNGSATVTLLAANPNIVAGQIVYGNNIPANTYVESVSGTTLVLSQTATATATGVDLGFGKFSGGTGGMSVGTTLSTSAATINPGVYNLTLAAHINNALISVGMKITEISGLIGPDTYVASINGTALGLSKATINSTTSAGNQVLTFSATTSALTGNAAYITNDDGLTNSFGGNAVPRTVYFYRDITNSSPSEDAMTLTFDVRSAPPTFSSAGWQVWAAPISQTVVGTDTQVTSVMAYGVNWPGATLISFNAGPQTATTRNTAFIPKSFAGTPFRLIFVWSNSSSAAGTVVPAAIDNISLTSRISDEFTTAHSGLWSQPSTWIGNKVPTPADSAIIAANHTVVIDSRYSGCENLYLSGANSLMQYAITNIMDEFIVGNEFAISGSGARFNNHDGTTNAKLLKVGGNFSVGNNARFDSSMGTATNFLGRLTLNGTSPQTVTLHSSGFFGGNTVSNAFANTAGVLNQLEVTNTSSELPNIIWNADGVRIKSQLILTTGKVRIASGKRIVLGNFGALNNITVPSGYGFTDGTVSKWVNSGFTKIVQPGTEYPGSDNNFTPFRYPFISGNSLDRTLYFLPDAAPVNPGGEVAVTYTDSDAINDLSVTDASYTINKRYNGNWAFSTPDATNTDTPVIYTPNATTPTNKIGIYADGAFEALDGTARLMNASAALAGAHQDGTQRPFVFRKDLTLANLTAAPVYVGVNNASVVNTTVNAISSVQSGDWNTASTWAGGVVPACNNVVTIVNGHSVTVTTTANAAGIIIKQGGTLINNAGTTTMTVGCTNNNAAFYNYGTHNMTAGNLKVNGFVSHKQNSFFNQTGGEIIIDSNNNGDAATSVAAGGASCKIETSNLGLTGGKITIVDPLVNISSPLLTASSLGNYTLNSAGATGVYGLTTTSDISTNTVALTGQYNTFFVGQVITGHDNIPTGTTVTNVAVGFVGFPPPLTLTLSNNVTGTVPAGTFLNFSSMVNNASSIVLAPSVTNSNLSVGQGITGPGIQTGTTITGLGTSAGIPTQDLRRIDLSLPVKDLPMPITSPQTFTFSVVNEGSYSTVLEAPNTNIKAGMMVKGTGIKPGTFVTADVTSTNASLSLSEPIQEGATSPLVMEFYSFNAQSSGSFIYASPVHYAAGLDHTLQIGDGVSTQNTAFITTGFNCQFQAGLGLFSLGNLTVNAPNGNERFMNVSSNGINNNYTMNVQNTFTVTNNSVFKKTFANSTVYVGGNIVNNGTIHFPWNGTVLYLGNLINGVIAPTTLAQTISGTGTWKTDQWALSSGPKTGFNFSGFTVNNTSPEGVTLQTPIKVSGTVILTNGILHTSAANPIYLGVEDVTDLSYSSAVAQYTASGGSNTTHIDGPCVLSFRSDTGIAHFKLLPTGKNGKYLPITLTATGGVKLMAEAFDTNSGTSSNPANGTLSNNRWKVTRLDTNGDFTGYNVRMGSTEIESSNIIVHSATENGAYNVVSNPSSATNFTPGAFNTIQLATPQTDGFLGNFSYTEGLACVGTPAPGATVASSDSDCGGPSTILTLTNAVTGTNVTYQWQSSTNGGSTWANIADATSTSYVATPAVNTSYRCNVTCSGSTGTSTPVAVTAKTTTVTVTGTTITCSGVADLTAAGGTVLNWYDDPTAGSLVATGTTYSPNVSETTTYYVASATGTTSNNSVNNTFTGTTSTNTVFRGVAFDATNALKLKTVTVYPRQSSLTVVPTPVTLALYDAAGNIAFGTTPVTFTPNVLTNTVSLSQTVTLDYNIPAGKNYRLVVSYGLNTDNFLGTSSAAPTNAPGEALVLNGNITSLTAVPTATTNSYFYNLTYDKVCETVRVPVTVTVITPEAPTAPTAQTFCNVATVADLTATGSDIKWYTTPTGGAALATDTALSTATYYASQTTDCESAARTAVNVTVNVTPAPTAADQAFCDAATVADLTVTSGSDIQWYTTSTEGTALTPTTALSTTVYYASQTIDNCESITREAVNVTINVTPATPTGNATQDACATGTIADFTVNGVSNAIFTWYDAQGTILTTTTAVSNTAYYYVSQTVNGCESPRLAILASGACLSTDEFKIAELRFYPNPVADQLTITARDMITRVELFNLLGQKLRVLDTNTDNVQMNFNDLTQSTYLVKVYSEDKVQTFKVVKE